LPSWGAETTYWLALAAGALLAGLVYGRRLKKSGQPLKRALSAPVLALLLGLAGARLFYFLARSAFLVPMYGWAALFRLPYDGLAFGGAAAGAALAALMMEKACGAAPFSFLDPLAPAGAVMVTAARLGEYAVSFGQGAYVENPSHQFFPLAVMNEWEEWYYAVFMLEALIALCCLIYALKARGLPRGRRFKLTLTLMMLGQVFAESLRSESLKWGFVRVHQLFAVLAAAAVLAGFIRQALRRGERLLLLLARWALPYLIGVALLIGLEFALDKWEEAPNWALYLAMAGTLAGMGAVVFGLERKTAGKAPSA